jgi:ATP-dependent Clp protease ATP-binding subunit ClpC
MVPPDSPQNLRADGRDLVALAAKGDLPIVDFRETEIRSVLDTMDRKESVLLVGAAGVGKSAILRGVAHALHQRRRGGLVELSTASVLSGTHYLGEWQTKLTAMIRAAVRDGTTLVFSDLPNLLTAGVTAQTSASMFEALRPFLEKRELVLVGEVTPETLRLLERTPQYSDLFRKIRVSPLEESQASVVVERAAERVQTPIGADGLRTLRELTSRFLPTRPQPGPALSLLQQATHYLREKQGVGEPVPVDRAFIERVFSIYSGLPPFIVSRDVTMSVADLRAWFRERLVGQEEAIESVVEAIALFKSGLHDPSKPIGTFLFVGPTGVGKTELARALATFLFGSPQRMLRFDMSELKSYDSFEVLLGDPDNPTRPAALLDPVRAQPFQLVLLDEIEKSHPNIWDLLLPLLDEGRLTPPRGEAVDFRSTLVICTSNVGAQDAQLRAVGFGEAKTGGGARLREALELHFRPEFLNRYQHIVVFQPLTRTQVAQIARKELNRVLQRDGIVSRQLAVEVDESALDLVVSRGFDSRFGARALKREIQSSLVMPIAIALTEKTIEPGQIVRVTARDQHIRVQLIDTPSSRESRREREPIRSIGRKWTPDELRRSVAALGARLEGISLRVGEADLVEELERLTRARMEHTFWQGGEESAQALQNFEYTQHAVTMLTHLRTEIATAAARAEEPRPKSLAELVRALSQLETAVDAAELELVCMGLSERCDALVEIRPLGEGGRTARDLLLETYQAWAAARGFATELLREPLDADEPVLMSIAGQHAYGFLHHEQGLHRVVLAQASSVARVRSIPWTGRRVPVGFREQRALKRFGVYGGKIRSHVECDGGLVLQNSRSLAENRELALELVGSWKQAPPPTDDIVRRYEPETPLLRDVLTDTNSGHPEALKPERFHRLLCQRIRRVSELREPPTPAA